MVGTNTRGHTLELFQFVEIRVGFVLGDAYFERGAEHLVLGHCRSTRMPARRLRHSLELSERSGLLRTRSHFEARHGAVDTVDNCPNGRRRTIGPPVRILFILILIKVLELLHSMLLLVLLLRSWVIYA